MARTTIVGGTTSGYSLTGRVKIEIRPPTKITIDRTAAKIGRSMKKREKRTGCSGCQHDALPGLETALDHAQTIRQRSELNGAVVHCVVGLQHEYVFLVLIRTDRG